MCTRCSFLVSHCELMNNKDNDHELWDEEWLLANKNQRGLIKDLKVNKRWTGSGKI